MLRATIIAKGEVQRVGYRDLVLNLARRLGIKGYVKNVKPYDVEIVAEGDEDRLREFIEALKVKKFPIYVEELEVKFGPATGEYKYFEIKRGEWQEELFERLDMAGKLLYRSVELGEKSVELGEKTLAVAERNNELLKRSVELGEKSVELGEKNLEVSKKILAVVEKNNELLYRSVKLGEKSIELGEKNLEVSEKMFGKQDETVSLLKEIKDNTDRIPALEKAITEVLIKRYERLEAEVQELRSVVEKIKVLLKA